MAMNALGGDRRDFISYPTNRVVGTLRDVTSAKAAMEGLLAAGFAPEDLDVLHGEEDLRRLDPTGGTHGFFEQFRQTVIRTFELEEFKHLTHHIEDLRAGRIVIMVRTKKRVQRNVAADVLHQFGAEFVGFYGRWAWADLPPAPHATPEEIPSLFARAWNARDSDALASLFDEDAEFVNVTGMCWHDRESIRRAHADRLAAIGENLTVADGQIRVKLLAPEVAVVHARMMVSDNKAVDPRTTIASFVVHRAGERWLCASAHHTDLSAGDAAAGVRPV
jgi:uncharacterized protein (TIGR02246 family)